MNVTLTNIFPGLSTAICRSAVRVGMLTDSSDSRLFTFCSVTDFRGHVMTQWSKTGSCDTTKRIRV